MKKISLVVNVYVNTTPERQNTYDHPTPFDELETEKTFINFYNPEIPKIKNLMCFRI